MTRRILHRGWRCSLLSAMALLASGLGGSATAADAPGPTDSNANAPAASTAEANPAGDVPKFSRHIAAVFSRLGCNGGTCHGAVQGKNGFRLSLFAAHPDQDFDLVVYGSRGRRLNFAAPDRSLMLSKPTAQVPHGGGRVLEENSHEYGLLRRWIAAGSPLDLIESSRTVSLEVSPRERTAELGSTYPLRITAQFADGSKEDVTALCGFESLDKHVATVDRNGLVTARSVGDAALMIRYRSEPVTALVLVPQKSSDPLPKFEPHNFIDRHILAKLERLNIPAALLADDATFLRRAAMQVAGELLEPAEIRAFLADKNPDKRAQKIDSLLSRPGHAALWTLKFCDILKAAQFGVYADALKTEDDAPRFQAWIRARLEENMPYDEFASRILLATSREGRSLDEWQAEVVQLFEGANAARDDVAAYTRRKTLDLYWQRAEAQAVPGALQVAHSFLGLRLECAQCHRHPHDVWQQDDLLSFANFFTRVRRVGFEGDNEKKYPEVAERFKKMNADAKQLAADAKKLKDQYKDYEKKVSEAKASKDAARIAAAEKEFEEFRTKASKTEARGRSMEEAARRMMQAEVRHVVNDKLFASVSSPLGTQKSEAFRQLGDHEAVEIPPSEDPRERFVAWLRKPDNPFFAKAIVNRVWAHYFGRGIVDPPDHLSPLNPASHPELLNELAREFVAHKYDLKWLHRTILSSRTYQQTSQPSAAGAVDRTNYAYYYYRRLPAEVLIDAIDTATGTTENPDMKYYRWPDRVKAVEMPYEPRNDYVVFMLQQFGRPRRASSVQCDCERDMNPSVLQALGLANHPRIWQKIADPAGRVAKVMKEKSTADERIEELFLCTVSRLPTDEERKATRQYLDSAASPEAGLQGILWSLLNTREFLLQH